MGSLQKHATELLNGKYEGILDIYRWNPLVSYYKDVVLKILKKIQSERFQNCAETIEKLALFTK